MGADMPKQYLPLLGTPIALYSLKKFAEMEEVGEIVVVCDPSYRDVFEECEVSKPVVFALPGKERQDSVFNGLSAVREGAALAAIHDSARPLVDLKDAARCFRGRHGARRGGARGAVQGHREGGERGLVHRQDAWTEASCGRCRRRR